MKNILSLPNLAESQLKYEFLVHGEIYGWGVHPDPHKTHPASLLAFMPFQGTVYIINTAQQPEF